MFRSPSAKGFLLRLAALLCACVMTGCSVSLNVDTMLEPPRLSGSQEQIYQALRDAVGSEIRLKYPKRGSYLSAFIIADLDEDEDDEAIVFYEKGSAADAGLRINVLDCLDGKWLSICDRSAEGTEIEKVVITPLGEHDRINIIVGYSTANQSEKYLCAYSYEDSYLEQSFSHSYTYFDVADTGSGDPDLILLGAGSGTSVQAYAAVYRLAEDGRYHEYKYHFSDYYTEYVQLLYGRTASGSIAMYIDAATGTSGLQTEILALEDSQLCNLLTRCGRKPEDTVRRAGLLCTDIDTDGVPEIPVQTVFLGYESAAESDRMTQTRWLMMQGETIFTEHYSYYNAGEGYAFMLPESWKSHVTVLSDAVSGELRFCAYDGEWREDMPVLLRMYIAYDEEDMNEHLDEGFCLMHTRGTARYLVRPESGQALSVTMGRVLMCFKFLD